ncbi:hypothetical protein GO755_28925 [Spirosoma sp. HMF4905]|uniref:DUF4843 domain-containing protein n=1 Tax=Spirosoma arboris TaxID=2682092 RepID=A0A7K1SJX0_9BACT|nr:hypothetical protein [Spirosoma arboris]MVM34092.1 hypothetical protein [Spirosoma arboris]
MKKQSILFCLAVLTCAACKQDDPAADPASILQGNYTAFTYRGNSTPLPYPINGKTFTLQIKRITKDTVQVDIQATPNDGFSPGENRSYPKAYIVSVPNGQGKYTFNVYLTPRPSSNLGSLKDAFQFYNSDNSQADYYYVPVGGNPAIEVATRIKRTQ